MTKTCLRMISTKSDWRSMILILPVVLAFAACSATPQIGTPRAAVGSIQSDAVASGWSSLPNSRPDTHGGIN